MTKNIQPSAPASSSAEVFLFNRTKDIYEKDNLLPDGGSDVAVFL